MVSVFVKTVGTNVKKNKFIVPLKIDLVRFRISQIFKDAKTAGDQPTLSKQPFM